LEVAERGAEEKCLVDSLEFSVLVLEFLWALKCFSRSVSLMVSHRSSDLLRKRPSVGGYGFRWHFWQGLWYRWIVDREIGKLVVGR